MNSSKLTMTAQIPSSFGMPVSGHALGVTTCAALLDVQGTTVPTAVIERERVTVIADTKDALKGDMGLAQSYFPGITAWRPPTC